MRNIVFCRDPAGDAQVTVDDTPLNWAASLDVYSHSPSGPEWGYAGSGPAQCALAVLMLFTDTDTALRHYQLFKRDWLEAMPHDGATIPTQKIRAWLDAHNKLADLNHRT